MSYRLERTESISHGIRRIAVEQIDKAISDIEDESLGRHDAVHQVRKRFKKVRGLVRLVRPALGGQYSSINTWYRNAGRRLSKIRDATTLIACFDNLAHAGAGVLDDSIPRSVHAHLVERRKRIEKAGKPVEMILDELVGALRYQRKQVEDWRLDADDFDAICGGLARSFRRGRRAFKRVRETSTDEDLHDWRKRVKYHWYHGRLLQNIWPIILKARVKVMDRLSDLLGEDHDLAVLSQSMINTPEVFGDAATRAVLQGLIEQQRTDLQREAFDVGRRVYAESSKRLTQRWRVWWEVWQMSA